MTIFNERKDGILEITGSSVLWGLWEECRARCSYCSGHGELAATDRAAYFPTEYPGELVKCPKCDGAGVNRKMFRQTA